MGDASDSPATDVITVGTEIMDTQVWALTTSELDDSRVKLILP